MTLVSERTLDPPLSATAAEEGAPQPVLCGSIRWKGREKEALGRRALPPAPPLNATDLLAELTILGSLTFPHRGGHAMTL